MLRYTFAHRTGAERFLVELPDGELEVRGTTFEVATSGGVTTRVAVEEGVVEVRLRSIVGELLLGAGDTWHPLPDGGAGAETAQKARARGDAKIASTGARLGSEVDAAVASASTAAGESGAPSMDGVEAYGAAITLWQGGRYAAAASAFHAYVVAHPRASQVEDASFLEAASLARAGRPDAAALAAEYHLARFPRSFHHKEAAILIARAARDRGDCAQARAVLAPWLGAPVDPEAVAALRSCASP